MISGGGKFVGGWDILHVISAGPVSELMGPDAAEKRYGGGGGGDGDGDDVRIVRLRVKMQVWAMLFYVHVSCYGRGHA